MRLAFQELHSIRPAEQVPLIECVYQRRCATRRGAVGTSVRWRDSIGAADGGPDDKSHSGTPPQIELTILSQSSMEILRHLEDFSIDVELTYLDNEPIEGMRSEGLISIAA